MASNAQLSASALEARSRRLENQPPCHPCLAANGDMDKDSSIDAAYFTPAPIVDNLGDDKTYAVIPGACSVGIRLRNVGYATKYVEVGAGATCLWKRLVNSPLILPLMFLPAQFGFEAVSAAAVRALDPGQSFTITSWRDSVLPFRMGSVTGSDRAAASTLTSQLATLSVTVTTCDKLAQPYTQSVTVTAAVAAASASLSREV